VQAEQPVGGLADAGVKGLGGAMPVARASALAMVTNDVLASVGIYLSRSTDYAAAGSAVRESC
jgi:hypothetical protein